MIVFTIIGIIIAIIILTIVLIFLGVCLWDKYIEPVYRWYFKNEVLVIKKVKKTY